MTKKITALFAFFLTVITVSAQEMRVLSLKELQGSIKARTNAMYDINGEKLALVKVAIPALENVSFQGTYVAKTEFHDNEYWVYIAKGAKKMRVSHKNFLPLDINFKDFIDGEIASGATYQMNLQIEKNTDLTLAIIKTNLRKASIDIEGKRHNTEDGEFAISLQKGTHNYTLTTPIKGFTQRNGQIVISGDKAVEVVPQIDFFTTKTRTLTLTAEEGVRFKIDGVSQNKTGRLTLDLPAGLHVVESYVGVGDSFYKKEVVDLTSSNVTKDMSLGGTLVINSPKNAEFQLSPLNDALVPSKTKFKTGETISALGNYVLKATKKGYDDANITISVEPGMNAKQVSLICDGDKYYNGWNGYPRDIDKAIKEYKSIAGKDDIAQFKLAQCYLNDKGKLKDALKYWKKAASQGNLDAMTELGINSKSEDDKIKYLTPPAENGNYKAMYNLGMVLGFGTAKVRDENKALSYLQQANANEVENSSVPLAKLYMSKKDLNSAYGLLKNAPKDSGAPEVLKELGDAFAKSTDMESAQKAYMSYKLAIDNGCSAAKDKVVAFGEKLFKGINCKKDYILAEKCFLASPFSLLSIERLADYDFFGFENHKENKEAAVKAYSNVPNLNPDAQLRVAEYLYYEKEDIISAARWYENIYTLNLNFKGDVKTVFYNIGRVLYNKGSKAKAIMFYEAALKRGLTNNQDLFMKLGIAYYKGEGVPKNYETSVRMLEKGMSLGNGVCARMLANCYANGHGTTLNKNKAKDIYLKAISLGDVRSYSFLGTLYYKEKNHKTALDYWRQGAKKGDEVSMNNLVRYLSAKKDAKSKAEAAEWQRKLKSKK